MTYRQEKALRHAKMAKLEYADYMKGIAEKLNTIDDKIYNCFSYDDLREMQRRLNDVADWAEGAMESIKDYIDAMSDYEDAEYEEENEPDTIESLGLQGMF